LAWASRWPQLVAGAASEVLPALPATEELGARLSEGRSRPRISRILRQLLRPMCGSSGRAPCP